METDRVNSMAEILAERVRQAALKARPALTMQGRTTAPQIKARQLPEGYEFADWAQVRQAEQLRQMLRAVQRDAAWPLYIPRHKALQPSLAFGQRLPTPAVSCGAM